jgi:hypothetical protein
MAEFVPNEAARPNPALSALSVLVGTWNTVGTHPLVPGTTFHGRTSFAWIEGGAFLIMHSRCCPRAAARLLGRHTRVGCARGWKMFLEQLTELERTRSGEAMLQSIGPEELRLRIFALDRAGHIAVEGELTSYYALSDPKKIASLKFGVIEFDPTTLPLLVRELQSTAPEV